jgi:hypothetical protein
VRTGRETECEVGQDLRGGAGVEFGLLVRQPGELAFEPVTLVVGHICDVRL